MSSDNFNYVNYFPKRQGQKWSVTMGFMSDDHNPDPKWNSAWFDNATEAINSAHNDWTEYGVVMSKSAIAAAWPDATETEVELGS